ncbi:hypothetical protein J6590_036375 [Homalodisca vitripennis]|nr:hypothetical protein J6590_036375 [Homalodisca vitripennis]
MDLLSFWCADTMGLVGLCNVAKSCGYNEERKTPGGSIGLLSSWCADTMGLVGLCNVAKSCGNSEERKTPGGPMGHQSPCEERKTPGGPMDLLIFWCADTMGLVGLGNVAKSCGYSEERKTPGGPMGHQSPWCVEHYGPSRSLVC